MSPIVKSSNPVIQMTSKAIPLLALVTGLLWGCNGRSTQNEPATEASSGTHEHSAGAEHDFPHPQSYADQLDDPEREAWQKPEEVVELLACQPGMVAIDVGAGTGYFIEYLSKAVGKEGRVLALDTEASMIEAMNRRIERDALANVRAKQVLPGDPGLSPHSADRILIVNTWHHIRDRVAYARRLLSALRPGGRLLIVDFTMESPHGPPQEMRLTDDTVLGELGAAGFVVERLEEPLPYQYIVAGAAP